MKISRKIMIRFLVVQLFVVRSIVANIIFSGNSSGQSLQNKINTTLGLDGLLDETFGSSGTTYTQGFIAPGALRDEVWAMAIQPDGKIVVGGLSGTGGFGDTPNVFALARFTPQGQLDTTFGTNGTVWIPNICPFLPGGGVATSDVITGIVIQPDGKIVAGGISGNAALASGNSVFALARFLSNGELDTTFGVGNPNSAYAGTIYIPGSIAGGGHINNAQAITLQADGKIVMVGFSDLGGTTNCFVVARFLSTGQPDISFGIGNQNSTISGTVFFPAPIAGESGIDDRAYAVALQSDGKIVVGGTSWQQSGRDYVFALIRYLPDGQVDTDFGTNGSVWISHISPYPGAGEPLYIDFISSITIQNDGKILAGGGSGNGIPPYTGGDVFALARFTQNGELDTSFGIGNQNSVYAGSVYVPGAISNSGGGDQPNVVLLQVDGKIVLAGFSGGYFAIARFTEGGLTDTSFGQGNPNSYIPGTLFITSIIPDGNSDAAHAAAIQSDGSIILAGYGGDNSNNYHFTLARFFNPMTFASYQAAYSVVGAGVLC